MINRPRPPLRNDAQEVAVITPEGSTRPVLGTRSSVEQDRRAKVLRQWGEAPSPRAQRQAAIEQPLDRRAQTVVSYDVGAALRSRLNGGLGPLAQRRAAPSDDVAPRRLHGESDGD